MKAVKAHLQEKNPERVAAFEKGAAAFAKKVLSNIGDWQFFTGESMNPDGMVGESHTSCFSRFHEWALTRRIKRARKFAVLMNYRGVYSFSARDSPPPAIKRMLTRVCFPQRTAPLPTWSSGATASRRSSS